MPRRSGFVFFQGMSTFSARRSGAQPQKPCSHKIVTQINVRGDKELNEALEKGQSVDCLSKPIF
jgi:hypothetical protein